MSNEITIHSGNNKLAVLNSMGKIQEFAKLAVQSKLFLDKTSGSQEEKMAKAVMQIVTGAELGIGPAESMRGIDIISGRAAFTSGLIASRVKSSGKYDYRIVKLTDSACVLQFFENGSVRGESSFTIEDAKRAGLAGNSSWQKYPSDLLFARAISRGARRFCPDVFAGSAYTAEELGGDVTQSLPDADYTLEVEAEAPPVLLEDAPEAQNGFTIGDMVATASGDLGEVAAFKNGKIGIILESGKKQLLPFSDVSHYAQPPELDEGFNETMEEPEGQPEAPTTTYTSRQKRVF